jgi:hypothetical protein
MSVYIDMEMSKETTLISIGPGGTVEIHRNDDLTWVPLKEKAVPVPPHGRLIDADAVTLEDGPYEYDDWCQWALRQYQDAPTVIPASWEGKK